MHPIDFVKEVTPPLWFIYFVALMSNEIPFTNIMSTEFFSVFYSKICSGNSTYSVTNGSGTFWTSLPMGYMYVPVWGANQYLWHSINTCWIEIKFTPTESSHCDLCSKQLWYCIETPDDAWGGVPHNVEGLGGMPDGMGIMGGGWLLLTHWSHPSLWGAPSIL